MTILTTILLAIWGIYIINALTKKKLELFFLWCMLPMGVYYLYTINNGNMYNNFINNGT